MPFMVASVIVDSQLGNSRGTPQNSLTTLNGNKSGTRKEPDISKVIKFRNLVRIGMLFLILIV
jgi:hypothetical protein